MTCVFRKWAPLIGAASLLFTAPLARADNPTRVGTRALGMGGALRGAATGDAGLMLNPAGLSLLRAYVFEGAYQYDETMSANRAHVSIADSTSAANIAGGLYYTYSGLDLLPSVTQTAHQVGTALSMPFNENLSVGATIKYLWLETVTDPAAPTSQSTSQNQKGFSFDAGAVLRPVDGLGVGIVGYNLARLDTRYSPRGAGLGLSYAPIPTFLLAADVVADFDSRRDTAGKRSTSTSFMGGVEYVLPVQIVLRGGGGHDGLRENNYASAGISTVSEMGALDLGALRDLSGDQKETIVAVSARLFVPSP
ncbi:MAG: hypothetical protein SGI86_21850 [Deltaproteobacteria bacterium]|nr:hypothetical protein [Deltaproteobacteria bacterium]